MPVAVTGVFRDVGGKPYNADLDAVRLLNRKMATDDFLVVSLPISLLHATQATVNDDFHTVHDRYKEGVEDGAPAVVKYLGKFYVPDGHHRIMSSDADGKKVVEVRLYDLDGDTQTEFPLLDFIESLDHMPCEADEGPPCP